MMQTVSVTIDLETDWGGRQDAGIVNYGMESGLPRTAELLRKHGVKATFFVCGELMERYTDDILKLREDGHEIQCHGYSHRDLSKLPESSIKQELEKCAGLFSRHGIELSGFRAPQGRFSERLFKALASAGFDYDSSVIRARIPGRFDNTMYPVKPFRINTGVKSLKEIPISPVPRLNLPLGLLWINTMGVSVFRRLSGGLPEHAVFYMHPFDIVYPKRAFSTGIAKKGWYSFRQKNAQETLDKLLAFFAKERKFTKLGEIAAEV